MQVSSFLGCFSLKIGTLLIAILHMIAPPLMSLWIAIPYFERQYWASFCFIQVSFAVMMLIGIVAGSAENMFPFLSIHFMTLIAMIYYIVDRLIRHFSWIFHSKDETIIMVCQILAFVWMYYSFAVVYSFYQELLLKKFRRILSTEGKVENNGMPNDQSILNNVSQQQPEKKKLNGEVIIQYYEDTKSQSYKIFNWKP